MAEPPITEQEDRLRAELEKTEEWQLAVRAMAPEDLYKRMSQEAHGDPRAVWPLYDEETGAIIIGPQRKPIAARASLLMYAGLATDQLRLIAAGANLEVERADEVAEAIRAGNRRLGDEADAAGLRSPEP